MMLCNAKAMVRVADVRPMGFWGLWCRLAVGVVVGRNDYVVEVVGGFGCAVEAVGVVVDEGFGYVVVMAIVDVVVEGFGYAVELRALVPVDAEYQVYCISVSLAHSLLMFYL
jgi:hypothetical protein